MSKAPRPRAHRRAHPPATVSVRPLPEYGDGAIEVRTSCRHATHRVGWRLGPSVTERAAMTASIAHHAIMEACACMTSLWSKYRTPQAPEDLDGLASRFNRLWAGVEDQQRRQGVAVVDLGEAARELAGEVA